MTRGRCHSTSEPLRARTDLRQARRPAERRERPSGAFVFARLCDVAPDGASTLITRGVLNLCHLEGTGAPETLIPGELIDGDDPDAQHCLCDPRRTPVRLALSTSYWPWMWPSPEPVDDHGRTPAATARSRSRCARRTRGRKVARRSGRPSTAPGLPVVQLRARGRGRGSDTTRRAETHTPDPPGLRRRRRSRAASSTTKTTRRRSRSTTAIRCRPRSAGGGSRCAAATGARGSSGVADDRRCQRLSVSTVINAYEGDARIHTHTFARTIPTELLMIAERLDNIDVVCTDVEPLGEFYGDSSACRCACPTNPARVGSDSRR